MIANEFDTEQGEVCALGSLAQRRGIALERDDVDYPDILGEKFDIARQLAQEVMYENDEGGPWVGETPEQRWIRVRKWAVSCIREPAPSVPVVGLHGEEP